MCTFPSMTISGSTPLALPRLGHHAALAALALLGMPLASLSVSMSAMSPDGHNHQRQPLAPMSEPLPRIAGASASAAGLQILRWRARDSSLPRSLLQEAVADGAAVLPRREAHNIAERGMLAGGAAGAASDAIDSITGQAVDRAAAAGKRTSLMRREVSGGDGAFGATADRRQGPHTAVAGSASTAVTAAARAPRALLEHTVSLLMIGARWALASEGAAASAVAGGGAEAHGGGGGASVGAGHGAPAPAWDGAAGASDQMRPSDRAISGFANDGRLNVACSFRATLCAAASLACFIVVFFSCGSPGVGCRRQKDEELNCQAMQSIRPNLFVEQSSEADESRGASCTPPFQSRGDALRDFVQSLPVLPTGDVESARSWGDMLTSKLLKDDQLVRVQAVVEGPTSGQPLIAPLTGQACVLYAAVASRQVGLNGRMARIATAYKQHDFNIMLQVSGDHRDSCGKQRLRVKVSGDEAWLFDAFWGRLSTVRTMDGAPESWRQFISEHQVSRSAFGEPCDSGGSGGTSAPSAQTAATSATTDDTLVEFEERALPIGAKVTVVGKLSRRPTGALYLRRLAPPGAPTPTLSHLQLPPASAPSSAKRPNAAASVLPGRGRTSKDFSGSLHPRAVEFDAVLQAYGSKVLISDDPTLLCQSTGGSRGSSRAPCG
mmetsp:Transcript_119964/g.344825  ORF Transcript_119964/g.344825 Transcript_119964/m.344825 type:complete len:664 (-) Transcript_119964:71-2062(-)